MSRFILSILVTVICAGSVLAGDGSRRAQIAAATADAQAALEHDVLAAPITSELSVDQFVQRTHSTDAIAKVVRRAEQIGGARWPDEHTCQVRMELSGS